MRTALSALLAGTLVALGAVTGSAAAAAPSGTDTGGISLTPYDPAHYTDLYSDPAGPITGSTYIFNPTANFDDQIGYDFAHMRAEGVNTIGFYNLVQMTDADRDVIFRNLEQNHQKAVVRIEWYDGSTFKFDNGDPTHHDANSVLAYYNTDDPAHGYTALLNYLIRTNRLGDIAYFAVNMPVDDGSVANEFVTPQYPDGRSNPAWAAAQAPYADYLISHLRDVLGGPDRAKLYLSVFYGWDQSYPTPSYADIAHPADGYFFNNYSYPIAAPPDATASPSVLIDQPRLQTAMDRLVSQYPTQPKVIEYGFHTVAADNGVAPGQTAGVVQDIAAKSLALTDTTAYYANGSSGGVPFNVRGELYFAQNLYDQEGNPPAEMDWTLDYPATGQVAATGPRVRYYRDGAPVAVPAVPVPGASTGQAVPLTRPHSTVEFYDLAAADLVQVRYRSSHPQVVDLSVNGAAPRSVRVPAAPDWRVLTLGVALPRQGAVALTARDAGDLAIDWLRPVANLEAELGRAGGGATAAPGGTAVLLPAGRSGSIGFDHVPGASQITVRYAAAQPVPVTLLVDGTPHPVTLPSSGGATTYTSDTVAVPVTAGSALRLVRAAGPGDLAVDYLRVDGQYEAESAGGLYNGVHGIPLAAASEGSAATSFDVVGASVVFTGVIGGDRLTFRYSSTGATSMTVLGIGPAVRLDLPSTHGRFAETTLPVPVPAGSTVIVQRNADNYAIGLDIDWMRVSGAA